MSEMIERVARAIGEESNILTWDKMLPIVKELYMRQARVVIEAMRVPTDTMWFAPIEDGCTVNGVLPTGQEVMDIWEAMIADALVEVDPE